eukprot:166348-Rhodomonas_salina.1
MYFIEQDTALIDLSLLHLRPFKQHIRAVVPSRPPSSPSFFLTFIPPVLRSHSRRSSGAQILRAGHRD